MKYQLLQLRLGKSKHIHVYQDETGKNWMTPSQLRTALNMYRYAIDKEELESKQVRPKPNKSIFREYNIGFFGSSIPNMLETAIIDAFYFLYGRLKLGRKILPLDQCMMKSKFYIDCLPAETNRSIAQCLFDIFPAVGTNILWAFRKRDTVLCDRYLKQILMTLGEDGNKLTFQQLIEGVEHIKSIAADGANYEHQELYTIPSVAFYMLKNIKLFEMCLGLADLHFDNKSIITYIVSCCPDALMYASSVLKDDRDVVSIAVEQKPSTLVYASKRLKDDGELVLRAMQSKGGTQSKKAFKEASTRLQNDYMTVLQAVKHDGTSLRYASVELRDDDFIVLTALESKYVAYKYASERIRDCDEIARKVIAKEGEMLSCASERLQCNKEIVLLAVHACCSVFATSKFKDDEDVAIAGVKQDGLLLKDVSERLRDCHNVVLTAVKQEGEALRYSSERWKDNTSLVLEAVKNAGNALMYASDRLQNDKVVVSTAVHNLGYALRYASTTLQNNRHIVLAAVSQRGVELDFVNEAFRDDAEIVMAAIQQNTMALGYASARLRDDERIVRAAATRNRSALQYASYRLMKKIGKC